MERESNLARFSIWRGKRGMQNHDFRLSSRHLLLRLWSKWIRSSNLRVSIKGRATWVNEGGMEELSCVVGVMR